LPMFFPICFLSFLNEKSYVQSASAPDTISVISCVITD
jgi:hypothetical protein